MEKNESEKKRNLNHNRWGINKNTWELLFEKKGTDLNFNDDEVQKEQMLKEQIMTIIEIYTRLRKKEYCHNHIFQHFIKSKLKCEFPEIVWNKENLEYEFEFANKTYTFKKISDFIYNKELETNKRYGQCHAASINLGVLFPGAQVLSGYMNLLQGKYLHSVIELKNGMIMDYTKNVIMRKEEYIELTNFTVENILSSEDLMGISTRLNRGGFEYKSLSVFGKELLDDILNRNPTFASEDIATKQEITEIRKNLEDYDDSRG